MLEDMKLERDDLKQQMAEIESCVIIKEHVSDFSLDGKIFFDF